jgi:hypothetical protein
LIGWLVRSLVVGWFCRKFCEGRGAQEV